MTTRRKPKKYRHKRTGRIVYTRPVVHDQHEWDALDELGAVIAWSILDAMTESDIEHVPEGDPNAVDMYSPPSDYDGSPEQHGGESFDSGPSDSDYDSGGSFDSGGSDSFD